MIMLVNNDRDTKPVNIDESIWNTNSRYDVLYSLPTVKIMEQSGNLLLRVRHKGNDIYLPMKGRDKGNLFNIPLYSKVIDKSMTYQEALNFNLEDDERRYVIIDRAILRKRGQIVVTKILEELEEKGII
jgi:GTP cyclohydrolase II